MIEMTEQVTGAGVGGLDRPETVARVIDLQRVELAAQAEKLAVAAHWADLHAVVDGDLPFGFGSEQLVRLGGEGTPEVAEFASMELGAALGVSTGSARSLMAEALELRHRLPRIWGRVQAGELPAWKARKVAERTIALSPEVADHVDRHLAPFVRTMSLGRVVDTVEAAMLRFQP